MINSGNIKIRAIEKKEEAKSGKLYTNNYYSYNIDRHIKTDYHNISMEKGEKIHICCFDIVKSRANKVISKPFLKLFFGFQPYFLAKVISKDFIGIPSGFFLL